MQLRKNGLYHRRKSIGIPKCQIKALIIVHRVHLRHFDVPDLHFIRHGCVKFKNARSTLMPIHVICPSFMILHSPVKKIVHIKCSLRFFFLLVYIHWGYLISSYPDKIYTILSILSLQKATYLYRHLIWYIWDVPLIFITALATATANFSWDKSLYRLKVILCSIYIPLFTPIVPQVWSLPGEIKLDF